MRPKSVLIINYGMGNINSVSNALGYLGARYIVSNSRADLAEADAYILPGVGAFAAAMENLNGLNIVDELKTQVVEKGKPFLGICLGMQLLAEDSEEGGFSHGLGWLKGHVRKLTPGDGLSLPHVGWNTLEMTNDSLFAGIDRDAHFYFDHIYHLICEDGVVRAKCTYGTAFTAAIRVGNIHATQFHPEKSQRSGLKLLRNFLNFVNVSN